MLKPVRAKDADRVPAAPQPVSRRDFAATMSSLGPFEPAPRIAVGVSGGPDSMALALLIDGWARARGGQAIGLTVDHALRPGAGRPPRPVPGPRRRNFGSACWTASKAVARPWKGPTTYCDYRIRRYTDSVHQGSPREP